MTIKINAYDAKGRYERLSRELCDLAPDCERAAEIRNQQAQILRLHPELEYAGVDVLAEALNAQQRMIGNVETVVDRRWQRSRG